MPLFSQSMNDQYIVVFTRYPEPGKTKTRLIPALGEDGAAAVQKKMTEHTLATIKQLCTHSPNHESFTVDIRFAGGDKTLMQQWLGTSWNYTPQGEGHLGDRLVRAFSHAFEVGAQAVIAIGIDCPDITSDLLAEAFLSLKTTDVVIGPAEDGGYYLIGLSTMVPEIFHDIDWGTENVLNQTVLHTQQLNLNVAQLTVLSDVDRPDDLPIWERAIAPFSAQMLSHEGKVTRLSIIIPVLNEEHRIGHLLKSLISNTNHGQMAGAVEIIVADGGSSDKTLQVARSFGVLVLSTSAGRAHQMNLAAQAAKGDILIFLHADTTLPETFYSIITQTLSQPNVVAGAFELVIQGDNPALRVVEWGVSLRSHLFQMPYGDQALFLKRSLFEELGGFSVLPIMEDFELIQRLKQRGRVAIASKAVTTSGRRWEKMGVIQTTLMNQFVVLGYLCGIAPSRLATWYHGENHSVRR